MIQMRYWLGWMVSNDHVTLDGFMFDHLVCSLFAATVAFFRSKESVWPHILDEVLMNVLFKGGVFEFLGTGCTKIWVVFCDLLQDWSCFVDMNKNRMPHNNVMKKVWWEGIELCAIFGGTRLFSWESRIF